MDIPPSNELIDCPFDGSPLDIVLMDETEEKYPCIAQCFHSHVFWTPLADIKAKE